MSAGPTHPTPRPPLPRLAVCTDEPAMAAIRCEFAAAGWTIRTALDLPHPWSANDRRTLCTDTVDRATRVGEVADLLMRGVSMAVRTDDDLAAVDLFDQCRRLARAEWFDQRHRPVCDRLDAVHVALLLRIRAGDDVEEAARSCHLSPRTAARRLAEARRRLDTPTTAEAATRVGARIEQLRRRD
jgi:hypothetical protein